ncbi:MAG: 3-phosphoshikimate 1-carboxyvinyltransferase [Calditrichia bacterium]
MVAPPSKSMTHRALIISALSNKPVVIHNPLMSEDIRATLHGLEQLGYRFDIAPGKIVYRGRTQPNSRQVIIQVGESGTSARFLTALAALHEGEVVIDGSERMKQRPMAELVAALQALGIKVESHGGYLPLRIQGGTVSGNRVVIEGNRSSQFLSALLLIAPALPDGLTLRSSSEPVSRGFLQLTLNMMETAGVSVREEENIWKVTPGSRYRIEEWEVEGDYSNAAFFLGGAAITGGQIEVGHLHRNSLQGDRILLDILEQAGAEVEWVENGVRLTGAPLQGIRWDLRDYPDLLPPLAVVSLFARTPSQFTNLTHLRLKESDRLQSIAENIERLGGRAAVDKADLHVIPQPLHGGLLPSYNDHRIAMSFAMAGLRVPGVRIEGYTCVRKSYPQFWEAWERCSRS